MLHLWRTLVNILIKSLDLLNHSLAGSTSDRMYKLLLLFGILVSGVKCGYYFVTAPNIIRFNHSETIVVSVFGLENAIVKVWLQHGDKRFSEIQASVKNEKAPTSKVIKVTEDDLFDNEDEEKPRKIKICSEWNGQRQTRDVILSYQTGYMIVQTDKPIYTPLQKVKIRALALDESLKAVDGWQVAMDIVSPSNLTMARKKMADSNSGFFKHEFTLPPYPEVGIWTARAFYGGQYETESRSLFEVQEYVLPSFGVTIDVDVPYILIDTEDILVTVRAKYVYDKPVTGNARLTLNLKDENGLSEYILDVNKNWLETGNQDSQGSVAEFSIPVNLILNSPLLENREFPAGYRLEVVAMVLESATGKEEATSHEGTIFANEPYIFRFTRSKLYFRPGWEYYVKVEMLFANGQPATGEKLKVKMLKNNQLVEFKSEVTDSKGRAVCIFVTSNGADTIIFKAATDDERQESEPLEVTAYAGQNQVQVERIISNDDTMLLRAFTNMQGGGYTGMHFIVVTRGQIVYTKFEESGNMASVKITEDLQEKITPSARLLVFYVDKSTHELVADSIKFEVEKKCRGLGLNLETSKEQLKPGASDELTISGSPFMWVGLNVIDKALLLLNSKNVLRKNKMFDVLQSHDLGCGEGSGETNGDVIMKSGLTVLTNAKVDENRIVRNKENCDGKKRRKRDTNDCYYGANSKCCDEGYKYAEDLIYEADSTEVLDPYIKCYAKARNLTEGISPKTNKKALKMKCIMAFFLTCKEELQNQEADDIVSKSLDDESEYAADLARLADAGVKPRTRSDFRESWLFDVDQLDKDGEKKKKLNFPDSITSWEIQALGITPDRGMCIADAIDVKTYRDFFIQLDLPYKAVRLEHFDIKATIFSYGLPGDENKQANVYLHGAENLCYNKVAGEESPQIRIDLPPNSAKTVSFPMIPLKSGIFSVKVSAMVTDLGVPEVDEIEKKLYVVNEGVEEQIAINVCLDPLNQKKDCRNDDRVIEDIFGNGERIYKIDLTLPVNSIPQTGEATAYIQTNVMTKIVNTIIGGVDTLFQQPAGCGEQTMIRLAPTVYAMGYLKETDQVTAEIELKGNQLIRDGVNREVSQYRHPDGSYAAWQHRQSSTWLTAFVAKIFCQAKKVVDDAIDEQKDIKTTIDWLKNHVADDGSFVDHMPVIHREMIGQINERDPSLTAFVLITLQECNIKSDGLQVTVKKARKHLEELPEDMLTNNPYLLAISTYALTLSDSVKKYRFKALLHQIENRNAEDMYWGNAGGSPASAQSVETTSYALLAMISLNDFTSAAYIVRWLTSQRNAGGSFRTTQDTVVGLQALSRYSIATNDPKVNLKVTMHADGWVGKELTVTKENAVVQEIVRNLPIEKGKNDFNLKVSGQGSGIMTIDMRYNRPAKDEEECPFVISDIEVEDSDEAPVDPNLAEQRNCDVCGKCDEPDEPDYNFFDPPPEAEPKIESNFGRRKREANRKVRATSSKKCIRFSVSSINEKEHGMSIVNFGLETGVEIVQDDLDKLVNDNPKIARYEMPVNGKGFVVFYLNEITSEETKFIFRLKDMFEGNVNSRQPSSVKVYDYYYPDQHCTKFYGTGPNRGQSVSYECDKDNKQCQCLQSMCAQPLDAEIVQILNKRRKPVISLHRHTCNHNKANYAVLVEITSIDYNHDTNQRTAAGTVLLSIHQGIENLEKDDEMRFFWSGNCEQPILEEEKKYYIIGRDGNTFKTEGGLDEFRYPLMGTAKITRYLEPRERKRGTNAFKVFQVMQRYQRLMLSRGCAV